jgi:D-alanine-D-alanine ligase-like ATP-grasp enzyme
MQQSVARMSVPIDNALDFACGRLGGIALNRASQSLQPVLDQLIAEMRVSFPEGRIETNFDLAWQWIATAGAVPMTGKSKLGQPLALDSWRTKEEHTSLAASR